MFGSRFEARAGSVAAALMMTLAACGSDSTAENPALEAPLTIPRDLATVTCSPSGTSLALSAENTSYDKDCLAAPGGQAFTISFANRQKDVSHNVVILKSHDGETLVRGGEPFPGVKTEVYNVPQLPAGDYHFHCEVHPNVMQGNFIVS